MYSVKKFLKGVEKLSYHCGVVCQKSLSNIPHWLGVMVQWWDWAELHHAEPDNYDPRRTGLSRSREHVQPKALCITVHTAQSVFGLAWKWLEWTLMWLQKVGIRKDSYNTDTVLDTSPFEPEGLPKVGCVCVCVCPSNRSSDNHHFNYSATIIRFNVVLRPQRPFGLFGMGSPGRPPLLSHSSCLLLLLCIRQQHCITSKHGIFTTWHVLSWTMISSSCIYTYICAYVSNVWRYVPWHIDDINFLRQRLTTFRIAKAQHRIGMVRNRGRRETTRHSNVFIHAVMGMTAQSIDNNGIMSYIH